MLQFHNTKAYTAMLVYIFSFSWPSSCSPLAAQQYIGFASIVVWMAVPRPLSLNTSSSEVNLYMVTFFLNYRINFKVNQFVIYHTALQTVVLGKLRGWCAKRWKWLGGNKENEGLFHRGAAVLWNCLHGQWAAGCVTYAWLPFLSLLTGSFHGTPLSNTDLP